MEQNVQNPQPQVQPQKSGGKKIGCWIAGCLTAIIVFVLLIAGIVGLALWATGPISKTIEEQLVCLRRGDIENAYLFTSVNVRKATNLEQFKKFVSLNPSLAQNKRASFTNRKIENNMGYLEGSLTAMDGTVAPVKYQLVKENGVWKILFIQFIGGAEPVTAANVPGMPGNTASAVLARPDVTSGRASVDPKDRTLTKEIQTPKQAEPKKITAESNTLIEKIEVGTQREADGRISDAGTQFSAGIGDIKVSAYISGCKKGQNVSAIWFFNGEQITDPVVNVMEEDGDFISQFYLGKPTNGWPIGSYKVIVMIDDGKIAKEAVYTIQ